MTREIGAVRPGVRLGIDVGSVRVGVARSDPSGTIAVPVETIDRRAGDGPAIARIAELVAEFDVLEILVGLPLSMDGSAGRAAEAARAFAQDVADSPVAAQVRLIDERLTTVSAQRSLHAAGRTHRSSRSVIDQAAAVIVVQHALDSERAAGCPIGTTVRRRDT